MKRYSILAMLFSGVAIFSVTGAALAVTTVSGNLPAGTVIHAAIGQVVDSRTLTEGSSFQLLIDEPTIPAIDGASIHGNITDVEGPSGLDRARIGFVLTNIHFKNGKKEPIHAQVMNKNVTYVNTAEVKREQAKFKLPPMLPTGTVTPGPIAFQVTFRPGHKPSVTPPPVGNSGGYVYAANSNENIVIPAGTLVTMKLTSNLALP
ncbi:MAG TPA: hypothetical protein VKB39_03790 [Candidatus Baltobacteraceae bacterium]|nr:hypothetical protein [Candidatus Baltobacteraceae bacterium]